MPYHSPGAPAIKSMKFVIQRVRNASVTIDNHVTASIGAGLVVLIGIHKNDALEDCEKFVQKILKLRIFADHAKPINASVQDVGGEILLISQFTLIADCQGQNRPSFMAAAKPEEARQIYEHFVKLCTKAWPKTKTGRFATDMQVALVNDGPVTIILE